MIALIIKSYLSILLSIGMGALCVLIAGLYIIFRGVGTRKQRLLSPASPRSPTHSVLPHPPPVVATNANLETSLDDAAASISAIAGGDVLATKLDLARAYSEVGKTHLAISILNTVVAQGSLVQQEEARHLLTRLTPIPDHT